MNAIGKILVLIFLACSTALLSGALYLYANPVDWGWEKPRTVWGKGPAGKPTPNERIASRIDERVAAYARLREARTVALAAVKASAARLAEVESKFGWNHLAYEAQLQRLLWGTDSSKPKAEKAALALFPGHPAYEKDLWMLLAGADEVGKDDKGKETFRVFEIVYNDKDGKPWGVPKHGKPALDVQKPYVAYLIEQKANSKEFVRALGRIGKGLSRHGNLTIRLIGTEDRPGYYALRERESQTQRRLEEELVRLRPMWVTQLYNAELLRGRREQLEERVKELGGRPSLVKRSLE